MLQFELLPFCHPSTVHPPRLASILASLHRRHLDTSYCHADAKHQAGSYKEAMRPSFSALASTSSQPWTAFTKQQITGWCLRRLRWVICNIALPRPGKGSFPTAKGTPRCMPPQRCNMGGCLLCLPTRVVCDSAQVCVKPKLGLGWVGVVRCTVCTSTWKVCRVTICPEM